MRKTVSAALILLTVLSARLSFADGWGNAPFNTTKASNTGSVVNTRHNLTQSWLGASGEFWMNRARNDYGEVCVYCHTPHGANRTIDAPLWNRTNPGNAYTLYNIALTSGQSPTQPGVNSLTCLSCHDGTVAIDSVINMPGSGRYSAAQETSHNEAFLDTWTQAVSSGTHMAISGEPSQGTSYPDSAAGGWGCMFCHSTEAQGAWVASTVPAFNAFNIGVDLTNDHPVGVQLPDTAVYDFAPPNGVDGSIRFYDTNSNGRADANEVRFYDTGEGYEVECGSCHDPHGAKHPGAGGWLVPSFLRKSNWGSQLCLTCHIK